MAAFSKLYNTPEEYDRRLDRMLMYLARYAHQDVDTTMRQPTIQLLQWCNQIADILREENEPPPR